MQSITIPYLTGIILRVVDQTIQLRRSAQKNHLHYLHYPTVKEDELTEFIYSIPYFDERLKDFLLGKLRDKTIVISQTWETLFIVKTKAWAKSDTWLYTDPIISIGFYPEYNKDKDFLTLPY